MGKLSKRQIEKTLFNLIKLAQMFEKPKYELPIETNKGDFMVCVEIKEKVN